MAAGAPTEDDGMPAAASKPPPLPEPAPVTTLTIVSPGAKGWLERVAACVSGGTPLLVQDIGSDIHPALEPLVHRRVFRIGRQLQVTVGDQNVTLHPDFKLYLQVRMGRVCRYGHCNRFCPSLLFVVVQ